MTAEPMDTDYKWNKKNSEKEVENDRRNDSINNRSSVRDWKENEHLVKLVTARGDVVDEEKETTSAAEEDLEDFFASLE